MAAVRHATHPVYSAAVRVVPFAAFFLSGASSLVFQTIWSRLLHHVFGSSSVAISSVVSAFMAGLALGAYVFGRFADRLKRPLIVYAWAEVVVGICGLAVPLLVDSQGWLAGVNAWLRSELGPESAGFMIARFLCILPILIVPTTLMGGTLPLLARHFVSRDDDARQASQRLGQLYAVNTLGALCGVFLAGFVLMPNVGVAMTNRVAVGTNFALAALIFLGRRYMTRPVPTGAASQVTEPVRPSATPANPYPRRVRLTAAIAFGLSGATALTYEVVWSRALVNTLGASVYAFALILMTFLAGIASGSAGASGLLSSHARGQRVLALAAGMLLPVAAAAMTTRTGLVTPVVVTLLGGAAILVTHLRQRERGRREQALQAFAAASDDERIPNVAETASAAVLLWPLAVALGQLSFVRSRLSGMTASAVCLVCLLLFAIVRLRSRPVLLLAAVQGFIALATFSSVLWAEELSLAFASAVAPLYDDLANHVSTVMALMCATAALCVFPSACGMGAMFPLTLRLWSDGGRTVSRDVGIVYTGNTVGSIVGAWLPGFLLMPAIGMQGTLHAGIALNLLLGAAVLISRPRAGGVRASVGTYAAAILAPLAAVALSWAGLPGSGPLSWNISKMTLGAFRISLARDVVDRESWGGPELVYYRDGVSTTVTVERWGRHLSLKNNGKVDASNGDDMPTQVMVGALPLLLHSRGPQDLDVAVIGFGSGATVGATLQFPVRSVDVVELEAGVVEASRFFADVNHLRYGHERFPYVDMPRLRVHGDDGRNFLAAAPESFDVIVSEPSNPWLTGVSDLFTREHFEVSKQKLTPGGVYCQWVQLYELSPENVKVIYRTFAHHFAHVLVFSAEDLSSDTILVGSDAPLPLDLARLTRTLRIPSVKAELERAYVHSAHDVFARILFASRDEVMRYAQVERRRAEDGTLRVVASSNNTKPCIEPDCVRTPALLNSDDNAHIEFAAPRDLIGFERYKGYLRSMYARDWPYGRFVERLVTSGGQEADAESLAAQALSLLGNGRSREARRALALAATRQQAAVSGVDADGGGRLGQVSAILALLDDPGPPGPVPNLADALSHPELPSGLRFAVRDADRALSAGHWSEAVSSLRNLPRRLREQLGPCILVPYAYAAHRSDLHNETIEVIEEALRSHPQTGRVHPELYCLLARAHDQLDHFDKAVRSAGVCVGTRHARPLSLRATPP